MKRATVRVSTHLLLDFLGLPSAKVIRSQDAISADAIELLLESDDLPDVHIGQSFPVASVEIHLMDGKRVGRFVIPVDFCDTTGLSPTTSDRGSLGPPGTALTEEQPPSAAARSQAGSS